MADSVTQLGKNLWLVSLDAIPDTNFVYLAFSQFSNNVVAPNRKVDLTNGDVNVFSSSVVDAENRTVVTVSNIQSANDSRLTITMTAGGGATGPNDFAVKVQNSTGGASSGGLKFHVHVMPTIAS